MWQLRSYCVTDLHFPPMLIKRFKRIAKRFEKADYTFRSSRICNYHCSQIDWAEMCVIYSILKLQCISFAHIVAERIVFWGKVYRRNYSIFISKFEGKYIFNSTYISSNVNLLILWNVHSRFSNVWLSPFM
jgi:hypothetical protein